MKNNLHFSGIYAKMFSNFGGKMMKKTNSILFSLIMVALLFPLSSCRFFSSSTDGDELQTHKEVASSVIKKGVCVSRYNVGKKVDCGLTDQEKADKINDLNVGWYWNWSLYPDKNIQAEFVPQIWGASSVTTENLNYLKNNYQNGTFTRLLTFNEPEIMDNASTSSGMTLDTVLSYWQQLEEIGIPLSSPAYSGYDVNKNDNDLDLFMQAANQGGYRVDFISIHIYQLYYNTDAVNSLKTILQTVYDKYQLPIWLTEFGALDAAYDAQQNPTVNGSEAKAKSYAESSAKMLEGLGFVERYSWFVDNFDQQGESRPVNARYDTLYNDDNSLSSVGVIYKNIASEKALYFETTALPNGKAGSAYNQTVLLSGGSGDYTVTATDLPSGLTMAKNGVLSGKVTQKGTYKFTVTATDQKRQTISRTYYLKIAE
jgi:hypothetical protein